MNPNRVLVAFSSRSGSTAGTAEAIEDVLRSAGFAVDCRPKQEVTDVTPYRAIVLGSGMFVASRASDGGGFIARHAEALHGRDVWLFSTGPIGGRTGRNGSAAVDEASVVTVGRAIGARGVATFGSIGMPDGDDPVALLMPADLREVRSWASTIVADLGGPHPGGARRRHRSHGTAAAN
jgi:menaquinone-dependent protoporphyrinogen oxidase